MIKNLSIGLSLFTLFVAFVMAFAYTHLTGLAVAGNGLGVAARACKTTTVQTVSVGHQVSNEVSTSTGTRGWVMVQQPLNATNTVSFGFDDVLAVSGRGVYLSPATSTQSLNNLTFGLNTDFPYVGTVTARTNTGTTTVLVTTCTY